MTDKYSDNTINNQSDFIAENDEEIDLLEFVRSIRPKIVFIVLLYILGGVIFGVGTKFFIKPTYLATTKLYVVSSTGGLVNLADLQLGSSLTADYEQLLVTRPIIENVIDKLNIADEYTYEDLKGLITIENPDDTRILNISVRTTSPQISADIANELANQAIEKLSSIMDITAPNIAEKAVPPEKPDSPNMMINILTGASIFSIAYVVVLLVKFVLNNKIKNEDDIEKYLGMPPIGVIPSLSKK